MTEERSGDSCHRVYHSGSSLDFKVIAHEQNVMVCCVNINHNQYKNTLVSHASQGHGHGFNNYQLSYKDHFSRVSIKEERRDIEQKRPIVIVLHVQKSFSQFQFLPRGRKFLQNQLRVLAHIHGPLVWLCASDYSVTVIFSLKYPLL